MDNYIKIKEKNLYKKPISDNAENRYWHSFTQVNNTQHQQTIKAISASNNIKNKIAIAHHNQVEIFSTNKNKVSQNMARFKTQVLSLQLRQDSQLLATGHEDGLVNIMNLKTKTSLRQFKNFKKPVHSLCFSNMDLIFAASDDATIKLIDIPNDTILRSIPNAHNDFIRCIKTYQDQQVLSSSYDNTIKLFDMRNNHNNPVKCFDAKHSVESLLILPNLLNFVSAQDQFTTLWDFRKDSEIQELHANQQAITSLSLISYHDQQRVITGSLDHQIKFIRTDIFTVTHQNKWKNSVMCLDSTSNNMNIAIGGNEGEVEILQLKPSQENDEIEEEEDYIPEYLKSNPHLQRRIKNYKFYNRGIYSKINDYDFMIPHTQHQRFGGYDKLLVSFKYKEAMLKAFKEKQSAMILSLYEELADRGALQIAFNNLDQEELDEIIQFLLQKISNPKYQIVMLAILELLVERYKLGNIYDQMKEEVEIQKELTQIKGMLAL